MEVITLLVTILLGFVNVKGFCSFKGYEKTILTDYKFKEIQFQPVDFSFLGISKPSTGEVTPEIGGDTVDLTSGDASGDFEGCSTVGNVVAFGDLQGETDPNDVLNIKSIADQSYV